MANHTLNFKSAIKDGLSYRYHEPLLTQGTSAPLVVFLHGAGERGNDDGKQLGYPFFKASDSLFAAEPMFILAPQAAATEKWIDVESWGQTQYKFSPQPTPSMAKLIALVDEWRAKKGVDAARIYATGMSMGGYGVYDLLARKPEWFAAAFVVCGRSDPATAPTMAAIPFYVVQGEKDPLITPIMARIMVEALKKSGAKVSYVEYPGVGHDSWHKAYTDGTVRTWLFSQKRAP